MNISTFEDLCTEVFYKILDNLNTLEIFNSFYNLNERLNDLLIQYHNHQIDFRSMSRSTYHYFFNIIETKNIISLILSDDHQTPGQIGLFLSLINTHELHRLRSLTLLQIEERHLLIFLRDLSLRQLKSLTIQWRHAPRYYGHALDIFTLLSSIISHGKLRYLHLNLWIHEMKIISWPPHCPLQYLRIDSCSFTEYCHILHHLSYLKTLIINHCSMHDVQSLFSSQTFIRPQFHQLYSLSLENFRNIKMNILSLFLSVTPALQYLKIIGCGSLNDHAFDGLQWTQLIDEHLLRLEQFEFFFSTQRSHHRTLRDVFALIAPFSTDFWMNKKHWYVICDLMRKFSQIRLYSMPICQSTLEYVSEAHLFSRSTCIPINNGLDQMNNVHTLNINLPTIVTKQKSLHSKLENLTLTQTIKSPLFRQVTELKLELDSQWPIDSLPLLSNTIDLIHLVEISLNIRFDNDFIPSIIDGLNLLFKQTPNVHTIHSCNYPVNAKIIGTIVFPCQLKYVQMKINSINEMKKILEQFEHLSSVVFHFLIRSPTYPNKIIKWLKDKDRLFTFWCTSYSLHLWFDQKISI